MVCSMTQSLPDHWFINYDTISEFDRAGFLILVPVSYVTWLRTWQKSQLWRVDRQSHTGLIYLYLTPIKHLPVVKRNIGSCWTRRFWWLSLPKLRYVYTWIGKCMWLVTSTALLKLKTSQGGFTYKVHVVISQKRCQMGTLLQTINGKWYMAY